MNLAIVMPARLNASCLTVAVGENNGVGYVEITSVFTVQDDFIFLVRYLFTKDKKHTGWNGVFQRTGD